ncbi:hypothetical protein GWK41_04610 [Persephonella atlantica]|uniref:DUF4911 domain-containing protein n=1 Tax=Persephonella atlantica TaxID=2699429 RepID=A0ABS1GHD7_9AQUI|nr:hypothetical protein [Persephonella atlantica]MBK3332348.1 hypothetical protein [Persephonella atlantica]
MHLFIKLSSQEKNKIYQIFRKYGVKILIEGRDFFLIYSPEEIKDTLKMLDSVSVVGEVSLSNINVRRIKVKKEEKNG